MNTEPPSSDPLFQPENLDPRLQLTPDYGTLGPGSDIAPQGLSPNQASPRKGTVLPRMAPVVAIFTGVLMAIFVANFAAYSRYLKAVPRKPTGAFPGARPSRQLQPATEQKQAEALLEQAVAHSDGAVDQISAQVDGWQGKLQWDSQMATVTTAALNSNDMRVRQSGIEVELAAYSLKKNSASLNYLVRTAGSRNHAQQIWALWAMGLMGNRGVETDRVTQVLASHLKDSDADTRRWAVEALGLVGTTESLQMLLVRMHDDPSPAVRERAACSVAESGMFTDEQRQSAIPQLLTYTDDPSLDAQTHNWAFQALGDITHEHLPSNSAAWRNWYAMRSQ